MENSCKNCRWARFQMPGRPGKCEWPVPPAPPLPLSITGSVSFHVNIHKNYIWPDMHGCPVWEGKG